MPRILIILFYSIFFTLSVSHASGQQSTSWEKGHYYDLKGNRFFGLITRYDSKNDAFHWRYFFFKASEQDNEKEIYADSIKAYVIDADSFVVSHISSLRGTSFIKVIIDEPVKLYDVELMVQPTMVVSGGVNRAWGLVSVNAGKAYEKTIYYYGNNPDDLMILRRRPFFEEMSKIFASTPALLEEIKYQEYTYKNMDDIVSHYFWYKRHKSKKK
jgi:hypothetical protein